MTANICNRGGVAVQARLGRKMKIPCLLIALFACSTADAAPRAKANYVYVGKAARQIYLYDGNTLLARFRISLGRAPLGHKQREGDKKTPEGLYVLDYKNPDSRYHRSIHVSYPNAGDRQRARGLGVSPGGDIMIHGQPDGTQYAAEYLQRYDWTDGCIAVTNEDMDRIWAMIDVPVKIRIAP